MASSKPLLIPWLIEQIDSGRYLGVSWTNLEHTEFCIPWKHGLRQDSSDDDVRIFKAWAEISGGTHADATVWKRNFRSALRAKGCEKIADNRNDAAHPHKVYRLPLEEQPRKHQEPVVNLNPGLPLASPMVPFDPVHGIGSEYFCLLGGPSPAMDKDVLEQCLMELNIYEHKQVIMQPTEAVVIPEQQHSSEEAIFTELGLEDNTLTTQFRVSAYYRGVKVLEQLVENNAGFKVMFRPQNMESSSPSTGSDHRLTPIYLPSPDQVSILDMKQAKLTQHILDKLGDGLEVGVSGPVVHGLRRGDSKIYWSLCKCQKSNIPQEVRKQEPQTLYTMLDFIKGLINFMNSGGESPSFSLFFCFGEKWPDPEHRPWEKKLIMLEVIITSFEYLKSMAVVGGASSLQSEQLQISGKTSMMERLEQWKDKFQS